MRLKDTIISLLVLLLMVISGQWSTVNAQIKIGGNVYGGGNAGNTGGSTTVTVREGNLNSVYGGARMANIAGSAFVNIDGENTPSTSYILINNVYGGNDIAGKIGNIKTVSGEDAPLPTALTKVGTTAGLNNIDNTWNAFVRVSSVKSETTGEAPNQTTTTTNHKVYIGNLYGGSNGDYTVKNKTVSDSHKWEIWTKDATPVKVYENDDQPQLPELAKTYLEIVGGSIVYVFGGGNNATVTNKTVICTDNPSEVVNHIKIDKTTGTLVANDATGNNIEELLSDDRIIEMGFNPYLSYATSASYQMGSMFGGNNKVAMAIRPTWNLIKGKIRNLYSGGNAGNMTFYDENGYGGILLTIASDDMEIDNVYGGCRKADVNPEGKPIKAETINGISYPEGYAARVNISGGNINNVYGGNDISGNVHGGSAVGIHSNINQNVYGGGNGSYAYTDNAALAGSVEWGDFYYPIADGADGAASATALNNFRPNAESVSIRVSGTQEEPVVIGGAIYCGGNSATLKAEGNANARAELKIGSYVYADNVFLGNNGENMVKESILSTYAGNVTVSEKEGSFDFSKMDLTKTAQMDKYMDGAAMAIRPQVVFDPDYVDYSTFIGSLFVGGNVGSLKLDGKIEVSFNEKLVIFDKVVGGCNNANVPEIFDSEDATKKLCAAYEGGVLNLVEPAQNATPTDKLVLNFGGLKIQPMRWAVQRDADYNKILDENGNEQYDLKNGNRYLEWNTVKWDATKLAEVEVAPVTTGIPAWIDPADHDKGNTSADDKARRLTGGNVYGGCYNSGLVDGNVVINLNANLVERDELFDEVLTDNLGEEVSLYGGDLLHRGNYTITERRTGVILGEQGMDVLGKSLTVFGGGYGADSEIWGSTTVNLNRGYTFQIFGGGYGGPIGRSVTGGTADDYSFNGKYFRQNALYSCHVNLKGTKAGVTKQTDSSEDMAECEFMYGGGFFGPICGNTIVNLGKGRVFNTFAGSCNADILGHTETYVGRQVKADNSDDGEGFPYIRDIIYGGNDLGGRILGTKDFKDRVKDGTMGMIYKNNGTTANVLTASAYVEYLQGRADGIFGGCFGTYDYTDRYYKEYTNADGTAKDGFTKPRMVSTFVNFRPSSTDDLRRNTYNRVLKVYGAGQGYPSDSDRDIMQQRSYVLVDIPKDMTNYQDMEVFGAGAWSGLGMETVVETSTATDYAQKADEVSAVIDLVRGTISAAYGGSLTEGITRRTMVNVPAGSEIVTKNIFGGAYGIDNNQVCDVFEANVEYHSDKARVSGSLYGGNNQARRTLYGFLNIDKPVYTGEKSYDNKLKTTIVYGAGKGGDTWSQYTEVNLFSGAEVKEVYGGGDAGRVANEATSKKRTAEYGDTEGNNLKMGAYEINGLNDPLVKATALGGKYNTNVHIHEGAIVNMYRMISDKNEFYNDGGYAYGGGKGDASVANSGDVNGTTYIDLLGGTVKKDIYAAGTVGSVKDEYGTALAEADRFIASANVFIKGGTARNVYGGGWRGSVGKHTPNPDNPSDLIGGAITNDILGETNVVIGTRDGTSFTNGIPAIERNAYGGGEGGPVYGTAHVTFYNGYIGYVYNANGTNIGGTEIDERYEEKIHDETAADNADGSLNDNLKDSGCLFGGGYIDNSSVDITDVKMYGGFVRNCLFGGGEIAAIGRGDTKEEGKKRTLNKIWKAGETKVQLFDGLVGHHVFGGGRGYDNLSRKGSLYTDGYVFGKTEVDIHGGEVGTVEGVAQGYGNVFGGGDVGFVYGGFMDNDGLVVGIKDGERYDNTWEGYYYQYRIGNNTYTPGDTPAATDGGWIKQDGEFVLTEDCKVLIEPWCRVTAGSVTINGTTYTKDQYVPIDALNTMTAKRSNSTGVGADSRWSSLDDDGIIIHNAVFAGGNVTEGSDKTYAEATTVFGNATASIHDVYHRDLITIGTGHTGGLYGDGNLTFVDGYRGLNITNYGTDYYNIDMEISFTDYENLPEREQAYYELRYKCMKECTDNAGKTYHPENGNIKASSITADELIALFEGINQEDGKPMVGADGKPTSTTYWVENGVCSRYAGRIMNTIQRADFCGVFGSRMVMQGAQDRVLDRANNTNYTINRVREVSLNKKISTASDAGKYHGNYFGIYSVVNHLGALTSDVDFYSSVRTTDNSDKNTYGPDSDGQTFAQWKGAHKTERKRNNGNSHNEVALASGVYLELTTEKSTGTDVNQKDWGYITGVIELDLINVQAGVGGGFVYAKNVHGKATYARQKHVTLTELNAGAVTRRDYTYSETDNDKKEWETSGNFVHSTQTIIDDCYPQSNRYKGTDAVKAHYWYIKGQVYVYNQNISAYTGASNAYSEVVEIPLTITAASHGTMKLLDVRPNKYAYYSSFSGTTGNKLTDKDKLEIGDNVYYLNDPISYWDWYMLSPAERRLFVDETYVTIAECRIEGETYPEGTVLLPEDCKTLRDSAPKKEIDGKMVPTVINVKQNTDATFDYVFRPSNNMSHETGYILTYDVNNPRIWNKWYTPEKTTTDVRTDKIDSKEYSELSKADQEKYNNGPTYRPTSNGFYGQQAYKVSNIIPKAVHDTYQAATAAHPGSVDPEKQASFEAAYIVTSEIETTNKSGTKQHLYPGAPLAKSDYNDAEWVAMTGSVADAYVCSSTIKLDDGEYIYVSTLMTKAERDQYISEYDNLKTDLEASITPAYYCTKAGDYGGNYYETTKNYRGLVAWSSLSPEDREHFEFNYDALDLLIDSKYGKRTDGTQQPEGQKYQYDGFDDYDEDKKEQFIYSSTQPVDYSATYNGANFDYNDGGETKTIVTGQEIDREIYESLPNERRHYTSISVDHAGKYYVVNTAFQRGETPYSVGQTIDESTYNVMGDNQSKITVLEFYESEAGQTYYYCRDSYQIGEHGEGYKVISVKGTGSGTTYTEGQTVPQGAVINNDNYGHLVNHQQNFTIHGVAPTEYSTLYVSQNSDIYDLSQEKIITVIYQYDYVESDELGLHITPVSERHVVNIHVKFESGVPEVENINTPKIVLPGTSVSMSTPHVTPGAYQIIGGGWELFEKLSDVESHINGKEYIPNTDPLYWYQDGFYLAYYAKTYLGKTYSNAVNVSVANYHDLADILSDQNKTHHMYVDNPNVKRDSKVYINDGENGLTHLKNFFDLSVVSETAETDDNGLIKTGTFAGHAPLNGYVKGGQNLDFFLRTDITQSGTSAWEPIAGGTTDPCFSGTLHGDGHHISGLAKSLFGKLCGNVFNLGVSGSFTTAGIADTGDGFIENCWINTTATSGFAANQKPFIGNPTGDANCTQIVNCYYPEGKGYTAVNGTRAMPEKAFYDGEVAYNLNGFYLAKRYYDGTNLSTGKQYSYLKKNADGTVAEELSKAYYPEAYAYYPLEGENTKLFGYVENRYSDGDFIYAGGTIPEGDNVRRHEEEKDGITVVSYNPIWPDDYIFFGQTLNYGYGAATDPAHDNVPTAVNTTNRVFRAPAYFRSKVVNVAHFNSNAVFAQTMKDDETKEAYKNMTAIDFTGYNDGSYQQGWQTVSGGSNAEKQFFYLPLLDDDGLTGFRNVNLTKNLLAYTFAAGGTGDNETATATQKTANAVSEALFDYDFEEMDDDATAIPPVKADYRAVDEWDRWANESQMQGHWVQLTGDEYVAQRDHLLVDKHDFNAPISYKFADDKRMWYQRTPENFVDTSKGWDVVSLPFTAELVTTHQKGEITHFYSGSIEVDDNHTKVGHEYWLREFNEGAQEGDKFKATFNYPTSGANDDYKNVTNTFLWDYYYEAANGHNHKDNNLDTYQTYYQKERSLPAYPFLAGGTPYIIGFPGTTYYEFDLSGEWKAKNTNGASPAKLSKQVITFASVEGDVINVSDDEADVTKKGYTFKPNYLNQTLNTGYLMNTDGDAFKKVPDGQTGNAVAFRPYFKKVETSGSRQAARAILFDGEGSSFAIGGDQDPSEEEIGEGDLLFTIRKHEIAVTSSLRRAADVRIVNISGVTIANFTIQPGETIERYIPVAGVYIVRADGGRIQKKLALK